VSYRTCLLLSVEVFIGRIRLFYGRYRISTKQKLCIWRYHYNLIIV